MNTPNVGYVEVKYNGTWGMICMLYPDLTYPLAEVICRQLQLGPPLKDSFLSKTCPHSIQSTNTTWLTVINCQGFEASLHQCTLKVLGRVDNIDCGACRVCSVCLICQPQHANLTGISESPLSLKFWPSSESWENQGINILNQFKVWQSKIFSSKLSSPACIQLQKRAGKKELKDWTKVSFNLPFLGHGNEAEYRQVTAESCCDIARIRGLKYFSIFLFSFVFVLHTVIYTAFHHRSYSNRCQHPQGLSHSNV